MVKIAPSILSADFSCLAAEIARVEAHGVDYLHVDVMDGHFVPNITIGPGVVRDIRKHSRLPFDIHLMIEHPELYIEPFAEAGADLITVHAEACVHLHRVLQSIRTLGVRAGVALNPATPLTMVEHVLNDVDLVLCMTVNPGFGGQEFIKAVCPKISSLRQMLQGREIEVEVDGGINADTARMAVAAGADVLAAGSFIFEAEDIGAVLRSLRGAPEPRGAEKWSKD